MRNGAPSDGVRFLLYQPDGAGNLDRRVHQPLAEIGFVEVKGAIPSNSILTITAVVNGDTAFAYSANGWVNDTFRFQRPQDFSAVCCGFGVLGNPRALQLNGVLKDGSQTTQFTLADTVTNPGWEFQQLKHYKARATIGEVLLETHVSTGMLHSDAAGVGSTRVSMASLNNDSIVAVAFSLGGLNGLGGAYTGTLNGDSARYAKYVCVTEDSACRFSQNVSVAVNWFGSPAYNRIKPVEALLSPAIAVYRWRVRHSP
jgi:hypothetical protein